jgi:hypothetical protein
MRDKLLLATLAVALSGCILSRDFNPPVDESEEASVDTSSGGPSLDDILNDDEPEEDDIIQVPVDTDDDPSETSREDDCDCSSRANMTSRCNDQGECTYTCEDGYKDLYPGTPGCECEIESQTDQPDRYGEDLNCDGVDGDVDKSIFVSSEHGQKSHDGLEPATPVKTLKKAISVASESDKRNQILITSGTYRGDITIPPGLNLHGSYKLERPEEDVVLWTRNSLSREGPSTDIEGTQISGPTLTARVKGEQTYTGLHIQGPDVTAQHDSGVGRASIALKLLAANSKESESETENEAETNELNLRDCRLAGGRGGPGKDGETPQPPSDGATGSKGQPNGTPGGWAQKPDCGVIGGRGGAGTTCPIGDSADETKRGSNGAIATGPNRQIAGGSGGSGGDDACNESGNPVAQAEDGSDGFTGTKGLGGSPGEAGSLTIGRWSESLTWTTTPEKTATGGGPGTAGSGGGGGGAAGAYAEDEPSPAGGAGGASGCGADGGEAGKPGGPSMVVASFGPTVHLENATIVMAPGGKGGVGGDGAAGGNGGPGGPGGVISQGAATELKGGAGGTGGAGGGGGGGAGGCGGPSIGVALTNGATLESGSVSSLEIPQSVGAARRESAGAGGDGGETGDGGKKSSLYSSSGEDGQRGCLSTIAPRVDYDSRETYQGLN